jgi:hypothetical protein
MKKSGKYTFINSEAQKIDVDWEVRFENQKNVLYVNGEPIIILEAEKELTNNEINDIVGWMIDTDVIKIK